jgi:hypothetical protein
VKILEQFSSFLDTTSVTISDMDTTFVFIVSSGPSSGGRNKLKIQTDLCSETGKKSQPEVNIGIASGCASGAMSTTSGGGSESEAMSEATVDHFDAEDAMSGLDEPSRPPSESALNAASVYNTSPENRSWISTFERQSTSSHMLPQLVVDNCSSGTIYLLAPFLFGVITNCSNCEIVVGAVAHVLHLQECDGVRLTVAAGKVVIRNCRDCSVFSAALSQVIFQHS